MAEIRKEQMEYASKFMTVIWKELIKPYYNGEESADWWGTVLDKANKIGAAYAHEDRRLVKMVSGFIAGVETEMTGKGYQNTLEDYRGITK